MDESLIPLIDEPQVRFGQVGATPMIFAVLRNERHLEVLLPKSQMNLPPIINQVGYHNREANLMNSRT